MPEISAAILRRLHAEAGSRCGYCRSSTKITGHPLTVEHILPVARGGTDRLDNLWLSCRRCNEYKGAYTTGVDIETGTIAPLFDPRRQRWRDHFAWTDRGTRIRGLTATGRATVDRLRLNNDLVVRARQLWVAAGWHPPDPVPK